MIALPVRTRRWDDALEALDPEVDAHAILKILFDHVFPVEILVALELAQLRTFTIPTISKILHATRQYEDEGQKRLDDTRAILTEIFQGPVGSNAEREMIEHLNRIHGFYRIENDDFVYVLSTFVFDPWLLIERWGYRPFEEREKRAAFVYYRKLGDAMNLRGIPDGFEAFFSWRHEYEARAQRYCPDNEAVARGFLRAAATFLPLPLRPFTESLIVAIFDDERVRMALGLAKPPPAIARAVRGARHAFRTATKYVNPYEHRALSEDPFFSRYATYPHGYERLKLGPTKVVSHLARCPVDHGTHGAAPEARGSSDTR